MLAWQQSGHDWLSTFSAGLVVACDLGTQHEHCLSSCALQLVKNEPLDITYSYWDGSGHRRKITVRKGDTISDFLRAVRDQV